MSLTAGCVLKRDRGIKEIEAVFAYPIYRLLLATCMCIVPIN